MVILCFLDLITKMKCISIVKGRYLLAVSGGPDSMALLDMARRNKVYIEVAHVNYHKRDSAINDEKLVRRYCRKYSIKFHLLNVYPKQVNGNFQAYARKIRYEYFNKLCKKYKLDKVLLGHHLDDHLETYLMQMDKNIGVSHYGLNTENLIYGVKIYRPLLKYEKKSLIRYCNLNNVEYGIDESNLSDDYTRNRIRHHKVEKMSLKEKRELEKTIKDKNKEKYRQEKYIEEYFKKDVYEVDKFLNLKYLTLYLRKLFPNKSDKYYLEMIKQLKTSKQCIFNNEKYYLVKEYGLIKIFEVPDDYLYTFNKISDLKAKKYKYFKLSKKGSSKQAVSISDKDFPITIRNYKPNDHIKMKYGTKKINRFFIDNKIGLYDRLTWPIMLDCKGSAILVPEIGCDVNHYSIKPDIFMIKL